MIPAGKGGPRSIGRKLLHSLRSSLTMRTATWLKSSRSDSRIRRAATSLTSSFPFTFLTIGRRFAALLPPFGLWLLFLMADIPA
jgi:hypothetical protein